MSSKVNKKAFSEERTWMKISKIDINHLTEQDIKTLIDAEKHPTNVLRYREIINQIEQTLILSSNSYKCLVKDKVRNIIYDFHVSG